VFWHRCASELGNKGALEPPACAETRFSSTALHSVPSFQSMGRRPVCGKFAEVSRDIMSVNVPGYTIVSGKLQKMIAIKPDDGIYMISYCDNQNAIDLKDRVKNTRENRRFFEANIREALGLSCAVKLVSIWGVFWNIGTHYYTPGVTSKRSEFIEMAQRPFVDEDVFVVGECVALHQGWVNGALESTLPILAHLNNNITL
jgi:hypothetical protein